MTTPKYRIELADCTRVLLDEIAHKGATRKDIAKTYALALRSSEDVHWSAVNSAIIKRWSVAALRWIKEQAWSGKCFPKDDA